MNGERPKIEIFEPFGAAYEMMKRILFQPFDITKWFVIGFAAFLSGLLEGNSSFHFPSGGDWNFKSISHNDNWISDTFSNWFILLIVVIVILGLAIGVALMWISARGKFIFTDCVVKNRAAIAAPWKEYRREGNSFFFYSLALTFLAMVMVAGVVLLIAVPMGLFSDNKVASGLQASWVFVIIFVGLIALGIAIFFTLVTQLMIPVMYRRRCLALAAFFDVSKLVLARPGLFVLYVLFGIVLFMALAIISTVLSCVTCCIAALPYLSSVILLPALVWLLAFKLLFLRQFGPDYDVWAAVDLPVSSGAPPEPPVQPSPPSALPPSTTP